MGHVHKLQGNPIKKRTPCEDVEINEKDGKNGRTSEKAS
jgi:hypothetical protein